MKLRVNNSVLSRTRCAFLLITPVGFLFVFVV